MHAPTAEQGTACRGSQARQRQLSTSITTTQKSTPPLLPVPRNALKPAATAFGQHSVAEGQPGAGSPCPEIPKVATPAMPLQPKPATSAPVTPWSGTCEGIYQP